MREYVWLGWMPVAFVDYSSGLPVTYYVHTDQVMTPQKLTDALGAVVWDRVQDPFGVEVSATGSLTQGLRFPGQVADIESSFNQNWNRDYDPSLGRYVQSDPIGLMGRVNTYVYVRGNPLSYIDQSGLVYVPHGQRGHGHASTPIPDDVPVVADTPKGAWCGCGMPPGSDPDIDFVYVGGNWIKLRGDLNLDPTSTGYRAVVKNGVSFRVGGPVDKYLYSPFFNDHPVTPGQYLDDLDSGKTPSFKNTCVGFFGK